MIARTDELLTDSEYEDGVEQWGFDTIQVHAGLEKNPAHGQCTMPIYNTGSFKFVESEAVENAFDIREDKPTFLYSRLHNPTNQGFETRLAKLELGLSAVGFPSGTGAIFSTLTTLAHAGSNVICSDNIYGGTYHQFAQTLLQMGVKAKFCDTNNLDLVESLIDDQTRVVFSESMSNPAFAIADMEGLADLCHRYKMPLMIDNTFGAGGYFCQPARFGVDIIVHSATKWIGGHGSTLGGVVIDTAASEWAANAARYPHFHGIIPGMDEKQPSAWKQNGRYTFLHILRSDVVRNNGCSLSPMAAHQLLIGTETLSLRCERQALNARKFARWLQTHPRVSWVGWPGFENHTYSKSARKYLQNGYGSVVTFGLKGGGEEGKKMSDFLKLAIITANIGDQKTIVCHHWSTSHKDFDYEQRETLGVTEDLLRVSLGTEDFRDIKNDFAQAIDRASKFLKL